MIPSRQGTTLLQRVPFPNSGQWYEKKVRCELRLYFPDDVSLHWRFDRPTGSRPGAAGPNSRNKTGDFNLTRLNRAVVPDLFVDTQAITPYLCCLTGVLPAHGAQSGRASCRERV